MQTWTRRYLISVFPEFCVERAAQIMPFNHILISLRSVTSFFLWLSAHITWLLLSCLIACCTPGTVYLQFSCSGDCAPQHESICCRGSFITSWLVRRSERGQRYLLGFGLRKTRWYTSTRARAWYIAGADHAVLWALGGHAQDMLQLRWRYIWLFFWEISIS